MNKIDKEDVATVLKGIGAILGGLLFVAVSAWIFTFVQKQEGVVTQTVQTIPIEVADYEKKDSMQSITVIPGFENTVTNNVYSGKAEATLKVTGSFARGYLYVAADVEGKALQDKDPHNFDSVFASLVELTKDGSDSQFGGHLIQAKSLETPEHSNFSEMLFSLSEVPYKKQFTDPDTILYSGNWLEVLNDRTTREKIIAFSSTIKGTGNIRSLVLYYECAEGSSCSITIE